MILGLEASPGDEGEAVKAAAKVCTGPTVSASNSLIACREDGSPAQAQLPTSNDVLTQILEGGAGGVERGSRAGFVASVPTSDFSSSFWEQMD